VFLYVTGVRLGVLSFGLLGDRVKVHPASTFAHDANASFYLMH